jgi:hypothetical protein
MLHHDDQIDIVPGLSRFLQFLKNSFNRSGMIFKPSLDSCTKCNWVERFGKDLVRCFVSKSFSGAIIEKSLDFSKFRITDG